MTNEELLQVIAQAAKDKVTELDLSGEGLEKLPPDIGQLTNLESLDLSFNKLSSLPQEIGQLTHLQWLDLSRNKLSSLPQEIGQLTHLQSLNLYENQLSSLPRDIRQLSYLQLLDLSRNQLSSLSPEIGQLTHLQWLDLSRNQLSSLPREIGQLTHLQTLYLKGNQLSNLPREIGQLTHLHTRDFHSVNTSEYEKEIFISYAWGGDSETYVNSLDKRLQSKGITIIRDKRDLGYKGLIKTFMEKIGRGKCVIAVISDKYLKSPNCMFELVQIAKNGNFYDRIFPIVLADAQIYKPFERIKYIKHWENEIQQLDAAMKEVNAANMQGFREEIDQYTEIRNTIAELTNLLKDMNTLTPDIHSESEFEELLQAIAQRLDE